jgi:ABC-type bacteriocin/lantibiotic exporter with double-glycine peptidase domain
MVVALPFSARAEVQCGPYMNSGLQQCIAGIDSGLANIDVQEKSQWCWAACLSMIFRFYGHPVSQARIVREAWGRTVNLPAEPWQVVEALNRTWVDDNGEEFEVSGDVENTTAITATEDLRANHPLIIGTCGHAVVLTAVTYVQDKSGNGEVTAAIVRDPWPGRGRRHLTPKEWNEIDLAVRIVVE